MIKASSFRVLVLLLLAVVEPPFSVSAQEPEATGERDPAPAREHAASGIGGELPVGPGDLLSIEVVGLDELDRETRVANDGTIRLPLVGAVDVRGLTPMEIERRIAVELREKKLVNDATVAVVVEEYVSQGVSVMGAVAKPGTYQVVGGKTVFDVVLEAGGLSGIAREILVIRQVGPGRTERIVIDAMKLLVQGDLSRDLPLQVGDILMVPEETLFKVYVSGSVGSQGPIDFPAGAPLTLLQALSAAGGASERAKLGAVRILRRRPDGTSEVIMGNLKRIQKGLDPDIVLEPDDSIIVDERFF